MRGSLVLHHTDREEIDKRLCAGASLMDVAKWIRAIYLNNQKKWVTESTLQAYRKNYLNVEGDTLKDLLLVKREEDRLQKKEDKKELQKVTKSYVEAKTKAVESILDVNETISYINEKIMDRIELLEGLNTSHLNDKIICEYMGQLRGLMTDYHKIVNQVTGEKGTNVNINISQTKGYVSLLKQAVQETLFEMAPELVSVFLEKLQNKLSKIENDDSEAKEIFKRAEKFNEVNKIEPKNINIEVST